MGYLKGTDRLPPSARAEHERRVREHQQRVEAEERRLMGEAGYDARKRFAKAASARRRRAG